MVTLFMVRSRSQMTWTRLSSTSSAELGTLGSWRSYSPANWAWVMKMSGSALLTTNTSASGSAATSVVNRSSSSSRSGVNMFSGGLSITAVTTWYSSTTWSRR